LLIKAVILGNFIYICNWIFGSLQVPGDLNTVLSL
jgi:hypothetical protein